jgi:fibronectin type 3 domain-containing protein
MKKRLIFTLIVMLAGMTALNAHPINASKAKSIGQKFVSANFNTTLKTNDLQLVYTGTSDRNEACFYAFNLGQEGFVIVSADDRFRPIVGYSDEGPFETENMSPELEFYLGKIIEARTSRAAVLDDRTAEEWQSVATTGKLLSRNGGRGVDYICTTKWNQDSPYNLYAPEAGGGPGGRCYAGCVATAMSQVMKRWNHPAQGSSSHSYYCQGYGTQSANFGNTTYDWDHMPDHLSGASQEEIEAVALLMYHCGVAVDMQFSPSGSGANSWDVPSAIRRYFSYSNNSSLKNRDEYSLTNWQNMLKDQFDIGWPVYYSGFSNSGGHAFVCDGYDDNDLFHFNWGWGGSSDGWFVIDEIDYAGWAQAVFNYVPSDVYNYQPMQPDNLAVEPSNDFDYSATLSWTNPTQNIHLNSLSSIDQIVITRDGVIIETLSDVTPGQDMTFTDHYMPAMVTYGVYAVSHNAAGLPATEPDVLIGPTCQWTVTMSSSDAQGWHEGSLSFVNEAGNVVANVTLNSSNANRTITLPLGHVEILWNTPTQNVENLSFVVKNENGTVKAHFHGPSNNLNKGLFYILNNTCSDKDTEVEGPTHLTVAQTGQNAELNWDPADIPNTINYHVYRDNILYAVVTDTHFTDTEIGDVFHNYYVTAFSEEGETMASNLCNVIPESPCETPTNFRYEMATPTKVSLSWDAPENQPTGYMIYRRSRGEEFKRVKSTSSTFVYDNIANQPDQHFEYAVVAYYRDNDCTSGFAPTQDNPNQYFLSVNKTIIPQQLRFLIHEGRVVLQWDEATMTEKYRIYRGGECIGHSTGTDFIDYTATSSQSYRYTVTGISNGLESNHSNEVFIDWTTSIEETSNTNGTILYPNPTTGIVYVESNGLQEVAVFNLMGQEMMRQSAIEGTTAIDMTSLPEGTYFLKLTGSRNEIKKVVKIQ